MRVQPAISSRQIRVSSGSGKPPLCRSASRRRIAASRPGRIASGSPFLATATSCTTPARCMIRSWIASSISSIRWRNESSVWGVSGIV